MMISLSPVSKVEVCLKQYFLLVRIRSIQLPLPLKHVFDLIKLYKLKEFINDANLGFLGSVLKSPRITWLL